MKRRTYSTCMRLLLAVTGVLVLSIAVNAANTKPKLTRADRTALRQAGMIKGMAPIVPNAMPTSPTDKLAVPHYFGPYPNWANSPLTLPNAAVEIQGDGTGATAVALVDPVTQGIASIVVTSPGSGYTAANVIIAGGDGTATATATINTSGSVISVQVDASGGGYSSPQVTLSGGGGT